MVEADRLFYTEIAPAVSEIEDQVKRSRFLTDFLRSAANAPLVAAGSVIGVALSHLSQLPELVSLGLGAGVSLGVAAHDSYQHWLDKRLTSEQNQLFFYYRAAHQLYIGSD